MSKRNVPIKKWRGSEKVLWGEAMNRYQTRKEVEKTLEEVEEVVLKKRLEDLQLKMFDLELRIQKLEEEGKKPKQGHFKITDDELNCWFL